MEPDKTDPNDTILRNIVTRAQAAEASGPFGRLVVEAIRQLAYVLSDERDARRALARLQEQRDNRLQGEIAERSQRLAEVAIRLAAMERRVSDDPDRMAMGLTEFFRDAARTDDTGPDKARKHAAAEIERAPGMADPFADGLSSGSRAFRALLDKHERALAAALGVKPGERTMTGMIQDAQAYREQVERSDRSEARIRTIGNQGGEIRDLEAQVAALQKAIADVWALVEQTDGYGSPYWTEPGLDDTTPAQAVGAVLEHLRSFLRSLRSHAPRADERRKAMAALNAADRQSDDDQICGC